MPGPYDSGAPGGLLLYTALPAWQSKLRTNLSHPTAVKLYLCWYAKLTYPEVQPVGRLHGSPQLVTRG